MAKDRCRFHADTSAIGTCRQCAIPLCQACTIPKAEGSFCSEACHDKYIRFQKSSDEYDAKVRNYRRRHSWKKWAGAAVVVAIILVFLHMVYDVNTPMDIPSALAEIWSDIVGLF